MVFYKPETTIDAILDFANVFCDIISMFMLYLAFYFIIRSSFKPKKTLEKLRTSENFIDGEQIRRNTLTQKTSKTIEKYFEEDEV